MSTLYNQAPVGLCLLSPDFRYVRVNDLFASMHGMTGEEIRGKSIEDVIDGEPLEIVREALREAELTDLPVQREFQFGQKHVFGFNSVIRDVDGAVMGFSVMSIELSEEPHAETGSA